jgi:hypothetical protein
VLKTSFFVLFLRFFCSLFALFPFLFAIFALLIFFIFHWLFLECWPLISPSGTLSNFYSLQFSMVLCDLSHF